MIIVLCGPAGAGKSTLARGISERLAIPIYRPFRSAQDGHTPGSSDPDLATLQVPVNSWQEDLYTADVLAALKPSVILDRSMPSALAYVEMGQPAYGLETDDLRLMMARLWGRKMRAAGAHLFFMAAHVETMAKRNGRFTVEHAMRESKLIFKYASVSGVRMHKLATVAAKDNVLDTALAMLAQGEASSGQEP